MGHFLDRPSPVVGAPMAGVCTPALAAAVSEAGGLGFLAGGYLSTEAMADEVRAYLTLTDAPAAINLFTPQLDRSQELAPQIAGYRTAVAPVADRYATSPGEPAHDDDGFDAKVAWLIEHPVDVVSFTFGPVPPEAVSALHRVDIQVGFTVTSTHEAHQAVALGADFLVAQGSSAGGHRGTWNLSDEPNLLTTAEVTQLAAATGLPVIAAGGVDGPAAVRDLLAAGAHAVAVGTLLIPTEESKAPAPHQDALTSGEFTEQVVTRAFSGRWARALVNDFVAQYDGRAPAAYPDIHHVTKPIRSASAAAGDPQAMALWAGTGRAQARRGSAREVVEWLAGR